MRVLFPLVAALLLAACSDAPTETKAKPPEKPLQPITGRQAFQSTFPSARGWAADAQPLRVRSMNLSDSINGEGKASIWEITFVSESMQQARIYTWSSKEEEGNLHRGVFAGQRAAWAPGGGQEKAFTAAHIKIDTDEALKKAIGESEAYLHKPGKKPAVTFLLEYTPRFPDPTWRVLWGPSVGAAERQVFIDASTGALVGKE